MSSPWNSPKSVFPISPAVPAVNKLPPLETKSSVWKTTRVVTHDRTLFMGIALLFGTLVFFVCGIYMAVVSKFMPVVNYPLFDFLREDYYYSFLIPLLIPVSILSVYLNWLGMKFFRHNA